MSRVGWVVLGLTAAILLALGVGIGRSCYQGPTKAERRADSVLADTATFRRGRESRDSVVKAWQDSTRKVRAQTRRWKDSADALLKSVDEDQARAAALTYPLPSGISQHDSIVALDAALQAQKQVATRLRSEVVPALQRIIRNDSTAIWRMDATIEDQRLSLVEEQRRNDVLTGALKDLRHEKKGLRVLGIHLPDWVDDVALAAGAGYVGYRLGKGS